jgi:hypothetical protein
MWRGSTNPAGGDPGVDEFGGSTQASTNSGVDIRGSAAHGDDSGSMIRESP